MDRTLTPEQKGSMKKGEPVNGGSDTSFAKIPDATNLSWLAETADGLRGETLYLIIDQDDKLQIVQESSLGNAKRRLADICTPKTRPNRKKVTQVTCKVENGKEKILDSTKKFDAVFWTESSVEKFLYPYYRAHRLWDDAKMDEIKNKFDSSDDAVAIAHRAPSTSLTVDEPTIAIGVYKEKEKELVWMEVETFLKYKPETT